MKLLRRACVGVVTMAEKDINASNFNCQRETSNTDFKLQTPTKNVKHQLQTLNTSSMQKGDFDDTYESAYLNH